MSPLGASLGAAHRPISAEETKQVGRGTNQSQGRRDKRGRRGLALVLSLHDWNTFFKLFVWPCKA